MVQDVLTLLLGLGLLGSFAVSFAEKFVPVVPSYVLLMLLGMTASNAVSLSLLVAATAIGSLAASLGWFSIGRALGEQRVERAVARWGRFAFLKPQAYQSLASAYRRNRFWVTLLGQTVPVARVYLGLPAGVLRLRLASFAVPAAIGILCWNVPFLLLGFALRGSAHSPGQVGLWASCALVGAELIVVIAIRARRQSIALKSANRASGLESGCRYRS